MIEIKNNPALTKKAIVKKIKTPYATLIVPPSLEFIARDFFYDFIHNVLKIKKTGKRKNGRKISAREIVKLKLCDFHVIVKWKLKENEWLLITEEEIYYSKGDNTN